MLLESIFLYLVLNGYVPTVSADTATSRNILGQIMDKSYTDPTKTIVIQMSADLLDEERELCHLANDALSAMKNLIPVMYFQNSLATFVSSSHHNVFLVESYSSFMKLYTDLDPSKYDFTGRFMVVYGRRLLQMRRTIEWTFQRMWIKKILNVLVVVVDEGSVEAYSYFPYRQESCNNVDPVLLANISLSEKFLDYDFFPNRLLNMYGCKVKAGTYSLKPFTIIETDSRNESNYKGTEVDIIRTVAELHNFSVEFYLPENGAKWGFIRPSNSTGLMQLIQTEFVDLGFGSVGVSVDRNFYLKAGVSHSTSTFVFVVPPGRLFTSYEKLYKPFTTGTWKFLAVAFAVGLIFAQLFSGDHKVIFLKIFKIEPLDTPLLNMWTEILGIPLPKLPKKSTTLAIAIGWMVTGLLVRTLYQGVMFKYLHAGVQTKSVQTVEDFNNAGLYYYMYDVTRRFFATFPEILKMFVRLVHLGM